MSESKPYFYETEIEWRGDKDLRITSGNLPVIEAVAPPEFQGRVGNWSPEHLFVASLNSCYSLTLPARRSAYGSLRFVGAKTEVFNRIIPAVRNLFVKFIGASFGTVSRR